MSDEAIVPAASVDAGPAPAIDGGDVGAVDGGAVEGQTAEEKAFLTFTDSRGKTKKFKSEAEVFQELERGRGALSAFQEKAELSKKYSQLESEVREFFGALKNPKSRAQVLKDLAGVDLSEMGRDAFIEQAQLDAMSPEQRRLRELEEREAWYQQQLQEREQKINQLSEKEIHQMAEQITERRFEMMDAEIGASPDLAALPNKERTKRMMSAYFAGLNEEYKAAGIPRDDGDIIKKAAALLRADLREDAKALLHGMGESAIDHLGNDFVEMVRKRELARVKGGAPVPRPAATEPKVTDKRRPMADVLADNPWPSGGIPGGLTL